MTAHADDELIDRWQGVMARIRAAERAAARPPGSTGLLAVSKTQPAWAIRALARSGQHRFGENYLQEAVGKLDALADLDLEWHFIGPLQSNKTRPVAERFAWVHTVDRIKIAKRLSEQRPADLPPLNVCLQVNISAEASKSGLAVDEVAAVAAVVRDLPRLRLRGLMAIPAPAATVAEQRRPLAALRQLLESLNADGHDMDTLSMGMSDDLEAAVMEGATLVRVGTAVFGPRGGSWGTSPVA